MPPRQPMPGPDPLARWFWGQLLHLRAEGHLFQPERGLSLLRVGGRWFLWSGVIYSSGVEDTRDIGDTDRPPAGGGGVGGSDGGSCPRKSP